MRKPDKLHDLDLDAFAVELQRRVRNSTKIYNNRPFMETHACTCTCTCSGLECSCLQYEAQIFIEHDYRTCIVHM